MGARIALIRSTPGFSEPRFINALNALTNLKFEVRVVNWPRTTEETVKFLGQSEFTFIRQGNYGSGIKNLKSQLMFQIHIFRSLNSMKPEFIYSCDFDTYLTSLLWACLHRKKVIYDQFDPISARFNSHFFQAILDMFEIFFTYFASLKITANLRRIPKKFRRKWVPVINYSKFDLPNNKEKRTKKTLIYCGILSNDRFLVEISNLFKSEITGWELLIIGYGELFEELKNISKFSSNVTIHTYMEHSEMMRIASTCHAYLACYNPKYKNNRNTASNKLFEAVKLKLPLVTNSKISLAEIVAANNLGYIMNSVRSGELNKILGMIEARTPKDEILFHNNCEEFVESFFSLNHTKILEDSLRNI